MDQELLDRATDLLGSGRFIEALTAFDVLLAVTTDCGDRAVVQLSKARCHDGLHDITAARRCLAEARSLITQSNDLWLYVEVEDAALTMSEGNREQALMKLDGLLGSHSSLFKRSEHQALYNVVQARRGMILTDLNRAAEALPLLRTASASGIEPARLAFYVGTCHLSLGDLESAKNHLLYCVRHCSDEKIRSGAHYHLGVVFYECGLFKKAKQEFRECEGSKYVSQSMLYKALSETCLALGEHSEAEHYRGLIDSIN